MKALYPLITRSLNSPIAFLTRPIDNFGLVPGNIDCRTFLTHVDVVAEALDNLNTNGHGKKHAINMCGNRYLFLVSFCAIIKSGQTNLLPANKNQATQRDLKDTYQDCYIVHDGEDIESSLPAIDLTLIQTDIPTLSSRNIPIEIAQIPDNHLACISFTSGSTGHSKPNLKYWKTLHNSSAINVECMLPSLDETVYQLATMPAQHMWGLETSVLLPMFYDICMSDAQPLFPHDILDSLSALPKPLMLVSTPVHLRALKACTVESVALFSVLCATSPLTAELAFEIETLFSCHLREVYGCSEMGSMAVRRTAKESLWSRFNGIDFIKKGQDTEASAKHLPESVLLQDCIEFEGDNHFKLSGRTTDLIKIAGKRGSLFEINQILLRFEGIKDGIVLRPDVNATSERLCAIIVLNSEVEKEALMSFLREQLDSAFVPRPIYEVNELPRETNGKLLKSKIDTLLASLRK